MSLRNAIISERPRETSGSKSANRFDFQKDWAICKAIDLQLAEQNYVLILDFHDDILIIDSDIDPQNLEFYQVKSKKKGNWTVPQLTKAEKDKLSIMGKLINNYIKFKKYDMKLILISNSIYDVKLADGSPNSDCNYICISELEDKEKGKLFNKVNLELQEDVSSVANITYLQVIDMSATDHATYTIGKLAQFFDKYTKTQHHVNPTVSYSMLSTEFEKKNDYEWNLNSFSEVIQYKSVTRKEFSRLVDDLVFNSKAYISWNSVESELQKYSLGIKEINRIRERWLEYEIHRMDPSNLIVQNIRKELCEIINKQEDGQLCQIMYRVLSEHKKKHSFAFVEIGLDESYIKAAILMELKLWI